MNKEIDKKFLGIVICLVVVGFFVFISASLGLLVRSSGGFYSEIATQLLAIILGFGLLAVTSKIPYRWWRKNAFYVFVVSIFFTLLVFMPGIGITHGGASRWIDVGFFSLQPAEFLKVGFVIYLAAWFSGVQHKIHKIKYGIIPFLLLFMVVGGVLLSQPDMGTLIIMVIAGGVMLVTAGARWRDIFSVAGAALASIGILVLTVPYMRERIFTFLNPSAEIYGAGYQIKQALIAIGSGGWFGRGLGQSIQKFNFLPAPMSDSIFAVAAEELGFVGAFILICLFLALAARGFKIASCAKDNFGSLLVVGITTLIVGQSLVNIASMVNILPLTGMPLLLVSKGGSAFLASLAGIGMILNVSKYAEM